MYGYEYQGDSLFWRVKIPLTTFEDYYLAKTGNQIQMKEQTIIYNVFQMDGLKNQPHYKQEQSQQLSLFSDELVEQAEESKPKLKTEEE